MYVCMYCLNAEASSEIQIPPSDIGGGPTWTKDGSVTFGGFHTFYKDYASGDCAGRYRVRTNHDWLLNSGAAGGYGSDEWPPHGAFDNVVGNSGTNTGYHTNGADCSNSADCGVELILEKPHGPPQLLLCRDGSADGGSTYTQVGSFSGQSGFSANEQREFDADETLGPFTWIKFTINRVNSASMTQIVMSGFLLYGIPGRLVASPPIQIPPSDIGAAHTWTKDGSVTYGGFHTFYKDYASGDCAGRYRVRTNHDWLNPTGSSGGYGSNEWPPHGAFDNLPGQTSSRTGYHTPGSICSNAADCGVDLILEIPCSIFVNTFGIHIREEGIETDRTPTAVVVSGSSDSGSTYTQVGSYSGLSGWSVNEQLTFAVDGTLGPFTWIKFTINRVNSASMSAIVMSGFLLYGRVSGRFFNPRRIVAFHLSRGVCFDESGRVVGKPPSGGRCRCSCLRRAFLRQTSLGVCDARVIRQALKARRPQSVEERRGYTLDQRERQKALWKQMEAEMAGRQYEMGFVFSTEEIRARVLRAMAERKRKKGKGKGKGKGKKAGDADSSSSSSSDFDSDSSSNSSSGSGSEAGKEESGDEESVSISETAELYEDLAALLEALEEADKRDSMEWRDQERDLKKALRDAKKKADMILGDLASELLFSDFSSPPSYGGGATGEVVLLVPSQSKEAESEAEGKEGGRGSESRRRISVTDGTVRLVEGGGAGLSPSGSFGTFLSLQSPSPVSHKTFFGGNAKRDEESCSGSLLVESAKSGELIKEQPTAVERLREEKENPHSATRSPVEHPHCRISERSSSSLSLDSSNIASQSSSPSSSSSSSGRSEKDHPTREGRKEREPGEEEEKKDSKQKTKSLKRLKSTAAEVYRRLSACGLGAPAKRWRAPMAIVAPADASRDGTLPLRMSIKRNIIAVRVSQAKLVTHISDLSILTETLVFSCKMLLTLNVAFFLCLTVVFIGETDDRHTNRKPVTIVNAPRGFGLEGFGDMEAFLNASALKALVAYLCVEVLFALSVCPLLGSIWSAENSFGRLDPQRLIWSSRGKGKTKGGEEKNANVGIDEEGERGERQEKESENDEEKEEKEGEKEEEQIVSRGPWGLSYFDFPPGLSRETRKAKVPRMESARLYIRARRQEVVAQYVLAGAAVTFLLLLLLLFTVVGLAGEWFPLRHKQFVLREYLLSSLLVFCFALGFPFFLGIAEGIVVWASFRSRVFDWLLNSCPAILSFPELTQSRHISPGMDVVKSLDGTPTADWVVPAPAAVF
uniref:Uncharacterized protein n=1 Tax=Chromera velia CCMP2878 TaxID=1169474 RepID=A0A0G4F0M6_9ALVE|eukprot:Cvel_14355.t1-p1 / transcript=Cvel_14355.t1 / gene=Cvel_14355 / organism=Chromera_velia_CCMP2878 / gene_product=hypothetical protein / transcript_product=hypothetical protein / location=Cvel_scaffold1018:3567-9843(-) / protein_length=1260 / sequence_SO=supercontig / SO=protein_coding / is_pseudo=false